MKHYFIFLLILLFIPVTSLYAETEKPEDACISCHREADEDRDDDEKIMTHIFEDVHIEKGLSCADCHGGDPEAYDDEDAAMWDADDFVGAVDKKDEPAFCGKCHSNPTFMRQYTANLKTDQMDQYWTSHHGEKLKEGNENVAVCTDCHGVHGIYPVSDPRSAVYPLNVPATCNHCHGNPDVMAGSGFPTDQYEKFASSVHGEALLDRMDVGAPACNDCHGNHGAQPPSVYSISDICGTCHVNNAELFKKSHLKEVFLKEGISQCEGCHNYHDIEKPTDESLKWTENAACYHCHEETDDAQILADIFYNIIDSLNQKIQYANEKVTEAENRGMEISDLLFDLEDAHKVLIQTRTSIHSFNEEYVRETAKDGYKAAEAAIAGAYKALDEFVYRKKGLLFFSLILTFFVVVLYLKIKEIERN